MMGNFEAVARYKIGITVLHINNGGYSGYGPGFWGGGHDPYTWKVSDHASACMANMAKAVGFHGEDVTEPAEIIPALKRALRRERQGPAGLPRVHLLTPSRPRRLGAPGVTAGSMLADQGRSGESVAR